MTIREINAKLPADVAIIVKYDNIVFQLPRDQIGDFSEMIISSFTRPGNYFKAVIKTA